jgi:hypothetical protein
MEHLLTHFNVCILSENRKKVEKLGKKHNRIDVIIRHFQYKLRVASAIFSLATHDKRMKCKLMNFPQLWGHTTNTQEGFPIFFTDKKRSTNAYLM